MKCSEIYDNYQFHSKKILLVIHFRERSEIGVKQEIRNHLICMDRLYRLDLELSTIRNPILTKSHV